MIRNSSVPKYISSYNDINKKLLFKYPDIKNTLSSVVYNIHNDLNWKLKLRNKIAEKKINSLQNNYYEIKHFVKNKMNRLEKNNKKVIDFMKYSLQIDDLRNQKYLNYHKKNRDYLLSKLNSVPKLIEQKMNQIVFDEINENKHQKRFLTELKNDIILEMNYQRKMDNLRYEKKLSELKKMMEEEEKEKIQLINKLKEQKVQERIDELKYHSLIFGAYNNPYYPMNLSYNQGDSFEELMKFYMYKDMLGVNPLYFNPLMYQNMFPPQMRQVHPILNPQMIMNYRNPRLLLKPINQSKSRNNEQNEKTQEIKNKSKKSTNNIQIQNPNSSKKNTNNIQLQNPNNNKKNTNNNQTQNLNNSKKNTNNNQTQNQNNNVVSEA